MDPHTLHTILITVAAIHAANTVAFLIQDRSYWCERHRIAEWISTLTVVIPVAIGIWMAEKARSLFAPKPTEVKAWPDEPKPTVRMRKSKNGNRKIGRRTARYRRH